MPGFCICKRCRRFWICLNITEQCPKAAFWICLGVAVKLGALTNLSSKIQEKETPQENILDFFLINTRKTTFWMEDLIQRWTQAFLSKIWTLFSILKSAKEAYPLLPSCAPVSVAEYASVSLNMPKYPWICLNRLFWLCHGSQYAATKW